MALYLDGEKVLPRCDSASDTTFDDTNVAYEADNVQEALEKVTKSLTYAEYEALTEEEKKNGTIYLITDINGTGDKFQPVIYSEEEREIGVWKDGKPLYEKTLKVGTTSSTSEQYFETNILSADVDTYFIKESFIVTGTGLVWTTGGSNDGFYHILFLSNATTNLRISSRVSSNAMYGDLYVTLRYTKTTDTAGSGTWTPQGVPAVHYSTEEHIVGTWIDGSIVYEKTFDLGSETSITYNSWYNTGLSGFNKICGCFGMNNSGAYYPLNASIQSDTLHLWGCRGGEVSVVRYLTIQYTKSST